MSPQSYHPNEILFFVLAFFCFWEIRTKEAQFGYEYPFLLFTIVFKGLVPRPSVPNLRPGIRLIDLICMIWFAWFVVVFGINTTSDISKLLYVISRAVRRVKFETISKYHEWYLCQISLQIMLLFVYTTTRKGFVIFTCRYFKWSWNTTALSQSHWKNVSCSSVNRETILLVTYTSLTPLARRSWRWISE